MQGSLKVQLGGVGGSVLRGLYPGGEGFDEKPGSQVCLVSRRPRPLGYEPDRKTVFALRAHIEGALR